MMKLATRWAIHLLAFMSGWLGETVVASAVRCRPDRPRL